MVTFLKEPLVWAVVVAAVAVLAARTRRKSPAGTTSTEAKT